MQENGVTEIIEIVIGNDGLTLAHSLNFKCNNQEQLYQALADEVQSMVNLLKPFSKWSEIDPSLPDHKIEVLVAPPTSGTRDAWDS